MRTIVKASIAFALIGSNLSQAQNSTPADDSQPAASNIAGQQYPRVNSDLRVTFRLKAPDAQKVRVHLDKDYDLERDTNGIWSVTTTPQVPGFHYYWFILDGVNVCDPASETFYGVSRQYSGIEVPEKGVDFYFPKDVPHGEIRNVPIFRKRPGPGGAFSFILRRIMTPAAIHVIRCYTCSMAVGKMNEAGWFRER